MGLTRRAVHEWFGLVELPKHTEAAQLTKAKLRPPLPRRTPPTFATAATSTRWTDHALGQDVDQPAHGLGLKRGEAGACRRATRCLECPQTLIEVGIQQSGVL